MKKFRRKRYLINKSVQPRYMTMIVLIVTFFSVLTGWVIYLTTWVAIIEKIQGEPNLNQILSEIATLITLRSLFVILAGVVVSMIIALLISHRIAGPMFRLKKTLEEIGKGIIPKKVTLRKKDEFKELSDALNSVIEKIDETSAVNSEIKTNILKYAENIPEIKNEINKIKLFERKTT
jgi:methyl-accepting chemotaxis protein